MNLRTNWYECYVPPFPSRPRLRACSTTGNCDGCFNKSWSKGVDPDIGALELPCIHCPENLINAQKCEETHASDLQSTVATASADTGNYNGNPKYTLYPGRQGEDDAAATERLSSGLVVYLVAAGAYLTGYKHLLEEGLIKHFITRETHDSAFVCMTPVNICHVF